MVILEARQTKRSCGPLRLVLSVLAPPVALPRAAADHIISGFWTKVRDDIVVKSMEGRAEETHMLRGIAVPVGVSERIRTPWNGTARPKRPAATLD